MRFGAEEIQGQAAAFGFRPDLLEKVFRLLSLLETLRSNAFLRPRIALKGGTALNLFLFDLPRLSVDIDLNYVGSPDRVTMLADKPKVEQAIQAVCAREGLPRRHGRRPRTAGIVSVRVRRSRGFAFLEATARRSQGDVGEDPPPLSVAERRESLFVPCVPSTRLGRA